MSSQRPDISNKHRLPRGGDVCDFCGIFRVFRFHACRVFDFQKRPVFERPTGHWASCLTCGGLIEREEWKQLTSRVMLQVSKRQGITDEELLRLGKELKKLHRLFSEFRIKGSVMAVIDREERASGQ